MEQRLSVKRPPTSVQARPERGWLKEYEQGCWTKISCSASMDWEATQQYWNGAASGSFVVVCPQQISGQVAQRKIPKATHQRIQCLKPPKKSKGLWQVYWDHQPWAGPDRKHRSCCKRACSRKRWASGRSRFCRHLWLYPSKPISKAAKTKPPGICKWKNTFSEKKKSGHPVTHYLIGEKAAPKQGYALAGCSSLLREERPER